MTEPATIARLRLSWLVATAVEAREVTPTARTIVFDVPGWPGHTAGQHVDVKLTAPTGTARNAATPSLPRPTATSSS